MECLSGRFYKIPVPSSAVCELRQQMAAVAGTSYVRQESEGVEAPMGEFFPATRVGCLLRNWDIAWSI